MTLTLLLSVTSWALPPARLLLEQGKIPFGMAWWEGRGGCMHVCPVLVYIIYMLYFHLVVSTAFVSLFVCFNRISHSSSI